MLALATRVVWNVGLASFLWGHAPMKIRESFAHSTSLPEWAISLGLHILRVPLEM